MQEEAPVGLAMEDGPMVLTIKEVRPMVEVANTTNFTGLNDTFHMEEGSEDLDILMRIVPILVPILFSIIIITGFIGNILVVCVLMRNKNMRDTTNLLILKTFRLH